MSQKKDGIGYWIKIAVWVALSLCGWLLPATGTITEYGMKVLGIFLGLMFGWICLDLIFPSFFAVILMTFAADGKAQTFFGNGFSYQVCLIIFTLCVFCAYITDSKLDVQIAKWVTNLKFLEGKPWLFVTFYMVLIFALGYMIGIYGCIFVMWPITYGICEELGYPKRSAFATFMLFACTYICGLGMVSKPMDAWSLIGISALQSFNGYEVNYLFYTIYMLVIAVLAILGYVAIGKFVLKIDVEPLRNKKCTGEKLVMDTKQKIGLWLMIAFLVVMYAPSVMPKTFFLTQAINKLGVIGVSAAFLVILGLWRVDGQPICNVSKLAVTGVPWAIVFLMCANRVVIDGLQSADTGIIPWIAQTCSPMFEGLSPIIFYAVLIVFYGFITQFVHNVVLLSVFVPITLNFGTMVGANPMIITAIGIYMLSCALATAGASSRSGLIFGNTEWADIKWVYVLGIGNVVISAIIMLVVGVPLGSIFFPF